MTVLYETYGKDTGEMGLNSFGQYTLECVEALVAEQVNRWLLS